MFSISNSYKCRPADLWDEYRSLVHPSADLSTCLLIPHAYCFHFLLIQVLTCKMNMVTQFIYWTFLHPSSAKVPSCWPAYLYPCILSWFPIHPSTDLQDKCKSQFIYCTFLHPLCTDLLTCLFLPVWPIRMNWHIIFMLLPGWHFWPILVQQLRKKPPY